MDRVIEMDVKEKMNPMAKDLDTPIRSYIADEAPSNLIEATRQYPYAGGKRMRPSMVIAACGAVGGDKKKAVPLAVAIEYIHNFTLIHDDLMDGDEVRRGMKTVHVGYGMPTAVLAGDWLFSTDQSRSIATGMLKAGIPVRFAVTVNLSATFC